MTEARLGQVLWPVNKKQNNLEQNGWDSVDAPTWAKPCCWLSRTLLQGMAENGCRRSWLPKLTWYSTRQSENGQGLEKSTLCKYATDRRSFSMSILLTICSLSSQDTGAIYQRAPLVKLCGISFEASAWQKQCFPNENPIPKAGSNPRNGCMWLISQHFYLIKYNPCMCSAFLKKGRLSHIHLSPCH